MIRFRSWAALLGVLLAGTPASAGAPKTDRYRGADELAARIDGLMGAAWKKANITPARPAADAEWLRRIYLDLAGRIPSVTEARSFLADRQPDKRARLVESLLAGPRYPTYFAGVWVALLVPEINGGQRFQVPGFERWVRDWLASDRGYDAMVRELLTTNAEPGRGRLPGARGTELFFIAKQNKPEELASATSRLFLGVNLGCAQCHNHPFAHWSKEQFWSFAAFFSDLQGRGGRDRGRGRPTIGQLTIPGTEKVVKAKYLGGKEPAPTDGAPMRQVLVDWMTANDNPYFARAAVNRLWAHFLGTGFLEPLDEMVGADRVASHAAVLDELASAFAKQKYDPRWLIRAITATKAYQQSSARSHPSQDDPRQFARMSLRGLTGEQLFDSLAQATGFQEGAPSGVRGRFIGGARGAFLARFAATGERAVETQTTILQALTLMNGSVMTAATNVRRSEMLAAVADAPFLNVPGKIEALYLAALSRKPTAKELARLVPYVEKGVADGEPGRGASTTRQSEALADVFWALLNSAEFATNH